jgi:group I intron endonuclease
MYIGQTTRDVELRWLEHVKSSKAPSSPIHHAINKYGVDSFEITIIKSSIQTTEELNKIEEEQIALHKAVEFGYNCQAGGHNHALDEDTKAKISKSIKANPSKYWKGRRIPESVKEKISSTKKDSKQSLGANNPMFGKKHSPTSISSNCRSNNAGQKFKVTKDDKIVGVWDNKSKCARDLSIRREQVRDCLKGRYSSSLGYRFRYLDYD